LLSEELTELKGTKNTLILALVRGGVVIGRALADKLKLPLFPDIVRRCFLK